MQELDNDSDEQPARPEGEHDAGAEPESAFDALPDPLVEDLPRTADGLPYTAHVPPPGDPTVAAGEERIADASRIPPEKRDEMGFFDHLEELRSRIIKALVGLVVCAIIAAVYSTFIIQEILLRPARDVKVFLQATSPMGQVTLTLQVVLISGLIISIPWIIWQFWQFVKPGLYEKERRYSSWIAVATIFCFLAGVAFAYFVMVPTSLEFAANFVYVGIENRWSIAEYYSFVLGFILACGVVFEMPMLSFALSRFGILTPAFMRHYRRHAGVVILILSAIITPTPDPFNQLILAVPLYCLFEISILVAAVASRKREAAYAEMFADEDVQNQHDAGTSR